MNIHRFASRCCLTALLCSAVSMAASAACPVGFGWAEGLGGYLAADAPFPTTDTKAPPPTDPATLDCVFQQWSAEAFVWAVAPNANGVPRFLQFPTTGQLLSNASALSATRPLTLQLAGRSVGHVGEPGFSEGAGAIVEADGNMLVAPNGYPVYASVHMDPSYFATARANMIANGGYNSQPPNSYFNLGAAVFKATWLRLDDNEAAPAGAYTTMAQVPILTVYSVKPSYTVAPSGKFKTVRVALVGLHVVGYTENHPEFVWATFEHHTNTPRTPDNQFTTSGSDPNNFTLYKKTTPYSLVNLPNPPTPPPPLPSQIKLLSFDVAAQRFSPASNAVLENATGGSNFASGPSDIAAINTATQGWLKGKTAPLSLFQNYDLIGTVWFEPNTYVGPTGLNLNQTNAVGSVNLANTTAETFEQVPLNTNMQTVQNCFMCHNGGQIGGSGLPPLTRRLIGISHVLENGSRYEVPNLLVIPRQ